MTVKRPAVLEMFTSWPIIIISHSACVCECVSVCECVCERDVDEGGVRERE